MKIGAIGTSFIMDTILENMARTEGIDCEAIFSKTYEKGKALANKFNIGKVYTSLDDMLADKDLDWIYVCSPNSFMVGLFGKPPLYLLLLHIIF